MINKDENRLSVTSNKNENGGTPSYYKRGLSFAREYERLTGQSAASKLFSESSETKGSDKNN